MTDYLAYNFAKSYDIKKINFFNNEFDGYAIGELDIQISQDSTNGVDGRWVTIDHIDGDFNSTNGDFSKSVNTGPVQWIRFLMNYQGRGAHGGSPAFLLSEVDFHIANERGLSSFSSQAIENEDHYNRLFCEEMQGQAEHALEDLSRVDCLTDTSLK